MIKISVFFSCEIFLFINKEIGKILDFFFSRMNLTKFAIFFVKFRQILNTTKMKKKTDQDYASRGTTLSPLK
jgi:hypothetical protein